jgi:hypothetical protein
VNEPEAEAWMGQIAKLSHSDGALPDPAIIWWKARLLEKQAIQARVSRPIAIAQWASLAVAAVTMIALLALYWPGIKSFLEPAGFTLWVAAAGSVIMMGMALRFVFGE